MHKQWNIISRDFPGLERNSGKKIPVKMTLDLRLVIMEAPKEHICLWQYYWRQDSLLFRLRLCWHGFWLLQLLIQKAPILQLLRQVLGLWPSNVRQLLVR